MICEDRDMLKRRSVHVASGNGHCQLRDRTVVKLAQLESVIPVM